MRPSDDMALHNARDLYTRRTKASASGWSGPTRSPRRARTRRIRSFAPSGDKVTGIPRSTRSRDIGHNLMENAYEALTESTPDTESRWAFGTGFDDPMSTMDH